MAEVVDRSVRDEEGKVAFYVLLWKRKGITLQLFDDYWRDVHGPVCARLPGQHQYWQFHVAHNEGGIFPVVPGMSYGSTEEEQFDGIAELTMRTEQDRTTWFTAAGILMSDEHNIFSKAIGYVTNPGNSTTYKDLIEVGDPNGGLGIAKFHVMVRKAEAAPTADFRAFMAGPFARNIAQSDLVLKLRLHLFEEVDASRPDAAGVAHSEPAASNYQAAFEIAFNHRLAMEQFFASPAYAAAVENLPRFVKQISPFPERESYTFVYRDRMTLAGQRGSSTAQLITNVGATNQIQNDILALILGERALASTR